MIIQELKEQIKNLKWLKVDEYNNDFLIENKMLEFNLDIDRISKIDVNGQYLNLELDMHETISIDLESKKITFLI